MSVSGMSDYNIPADVPDDLADTYLENLMAATCGTGFMNLFACDQKIEHLNDDFYDCLLYTSPSPRDLSTSRMPSSA